MMEYKGYVGLVEFDSEAKIFHGDIINTRDVITFQGKTVDEIETAFKESIDYYIQWCMEENIEPERPYSGKFNVRLSPKLHREIALTAQKKKMSINSFIEKTLEAELFS